MRKSDLTPPGSNRIRALFARAVSANGAGTAFFCVALIISLVYRARLCRGLLDARTNMTGMRFDAASLPYLLSFLTGDLFMALVFALAVGGLFRLLDSVRPDLPRRLLRLLALAFVCFLLTLASIIHGAHLRLFFIFQTGLNHEMLINAAEAFPVAEMFRQMNVPDMVLLFVPTPVFLLLYRLTGRPLVWRNASVAALLLAAALLNFARIGAPAPKHVPPGGAVSADAPAVPPEISRNPVFYTVADLARDFTNSAVKNENQLFASANKSGPDKDQSNSVRLIHPLLVKEVGKPSPRVQSNIVPKKWNVLFIIMESVGERYIFDTSLGNPVPMPFVKKISEQGLHLQNNFAVSNSSPRSVFSIYSGLYPNMTTGFFSLITRNRIPSLSSFLSKEYDSFLVCPAAIEYYFPKWFFINSGLREMYGYDNLPIKRHRPHPKGGRNELDTVDFFLQRLGRARAPFFATYYSFAPHYPYFDYGKEYELISDKSKWIHRYYNNLRLLDRQIERIFAALEASGRLKDTIVVLTGDHSEAFGQHPKNWIHSLATYNENVKTPAIFYQPLLFAPRKDTRLTSHVDILPTLLDAMGIPYNDNLFQGESLLAREFRRRFIFTFGNENTVSSISSDGNIKLQISYKNNRCWALDLTNDPLEKQHLDCRAYPEQQKATAFFRDYQIRLLQNYNNSRRRNESFHGESHPMP